MALALIDGDVIAYTVAWNAIKKYVDPSAPIQLEPGTGRVMPMSIEEDLRSECLFDALLMFRKDVKNIKEALYCDDHLMAVNGTENYRARIYDEYKTPRHKRAAKTLVRLFAEELRSLVILEELAVEASGRESDDYIRIWANQCWAAGETYYVCSIDKDLKCIPGLHYNLKTRKIEEVSESFALKFFYRQLLEGDRTDNIPGIPGIGPKTTEKYLADASTEEELQEIVVSTYIENFGDMWYEVLMANGKLLYIQQHLFDYFTIRDWPVVRGIL